MRLFPPHWSRGRRLMLTFLAALLTLVILVAGALWSVLGTERGRLWLVGMAPDLLGQGPLQLALDGARSPSLGTWYFDRILLRRDGELWLDVRDLTLAFDPGEAVFQRRLLIRELGAEEVFFYPDAGGPAPPEPEKPETEQGGALPAVAIESFWLNRLAVRPEQSELPELRLAGNLRLFWSSFPLQLDLQAVSLVEGDDPQTRLQLSSEAQTADRLQLQGTLREAAGGWLANHLQLPAGHGIDAQFSARLVQREDNLLVQLEELSFPLVSQQIMAQGRLVYAPAGQQLRVESLALTTGEQTHRISGEASPQQLDLSIILNSFPLGMIEPWVPRLDQGSLSAELTIEGAPAAPVIAGHLSGATRYADLPVELNFSGAASREQADIDSLLVQLGEARLTAEGRVDLQAKRADLTFAAEDFRSPYLAKLGVEVPEGLQVTLQSASGQVTGSLESPSARIEAELAGNYRDRAFTAQLEAGGSRETVNVQSLQLLMDDASVEASGTVDLAGATSDLSVRLQSLPVELAELAGIELPPEFSASISGTGHLRGSLAQPQVAAQLEAVGHYGDQPLALEFEGAGNRREVVIQTAALALGEASLEAQGTVALEGSGTDIDLALDNAPLSLAELAQVELPDQLSGIASGTAHISGLLTSPQVVSHLQARGTYDQLDYRIVADASLVDRQLDIARLLLQLDGTTALAIDGYLTPNEYDLMVDINDLPSRTLAALGLNLVRGDFNGALHIKGTPEQPSINGKFLYSGQMSGRNLATGEETSFELNWLTELQTVDQVLQLTSEFQRSGRETGQFALEVPITRYLTHFRDAGPDASLPLVFSANGAIDLAVLSLVLDADIHRISGRAAVRVQASGDLAQPNVAGVFELLNTRYENTLTGTLFRDIQLLLRSEGTRITIEEAIARGKGNGEIAMDGSVNWQNPASPDAVDIALRADSANVIDREDLDGEVSGELALTGSFEEMWLRGELEVSPLEANIGGSFQSSVPTIEVTEVYDEAAEPIFAEGDGAMPTIHLDLTIEAEQQAYLRGRGLEAELRGEIELSGTLAEPVYEGEFSVIRGIFEVFGRKFVLDQGQVLFANNAIFMRIPGTWEHSDYTIRAEVSGTVEDLDISFSSTPPLPEDEVLSLVIFGESADQISPFQALRLASAIQTLRGGGGGFDLLGSTRETLGVDRLSVESATTESGTGVAVGVGKYLSDDVYLELKRTPSEIQPWQGSIEIQLTPRLHLKSTTGGEGQTGAELLWKRDF